MYKKEIQMGSVAKSYMRKGFLLYEEMRKYFLIFKEAVSHIWLWNCSILYFLLCEENLIFFFYQCSARAHSAARTLRNRDRYLCNRGLLSPPRQGCRLLAHSGTDLWPAFCTFEYIGVRIIIQLIKINLKLIKQGIGLKKYSAGHIVIPLFISRALKKYCTI
jgi:hypothetical protein